MTLLSGFLIERGRYVTTVQTSPSPVMAVPGCRVGLVFVPALEPNKRIVLSDDWAPYIEICGLGTSSSGAKDGGVVGAGTNRGWA